MCIQDNRMNRLSARRWLRPLVCLVLLFVLRMDVSATALGGSVTFTDGNLVSVDIQWGEMVFTYTETYNLWNPEDHDYNKTVPAGWTAEENWITVQNSSESESTVKATLSSTSNVDSVWGLFKEAANEQTGVGVITMELAPGAGNTLWFELDGTITTSYEELGEIQITILAQ